MDHECVNCAGIEQGKAFLAKAKEFESAALESALAAQLEWEGMQERLRDQQQLLEDTVQVRWRTAEGDRSPGEIDPPQSPAGPLRC